MSNLGSTSTETRPPHQIGQRPLGDSRHRDDRGYGRHNRAAHEDQQKPADQFVQVGIVHGAQLTSRTGGES